MNEDTVAFLFDKLNEHDRSWYDYSIRDAFNYIHLQQLQHNLVLPHGFLISEAAVINYYKSQNSWRVNQDLRSLSYPGAAEYKFNLIYVDLLNACLEKLPRYRNSIVWRLESYTTDESKEILKWYCNHIEDYIQFPQFLSCSKVFENVDRPNSLVFEFESCNQTSLHDIGDLVKVYRSDGNEDWEAEAIYKTNSVFKISGVIENQIKLIEVEKGDVDSSKIIIADCHYWDKN